MNAVSWRSPPAVGSGFVTLIPNSSSVVSVIVSAATFACGPGCTASTGASTSANPAPPLGGRSVTAWVVWNSTPSDVPILVPAGISCGKDCSAELNTTAPRAGSSVASRPLAAYVPSTVSGMLDRVGRDLTARHIDAIDRCRRGHRYEDRPERQAVRIDRDRCGREEPQARVAADEDDPDADDGRRGDAPSPAAPGHRRAREGDRRLGVGGRCHVLAVHGGVGGRSRVRSDERGGGLAPVERTLRLIDGRPSHDTTGDRERAHLLVGADDRERELARGRLAREQAEVDPARRDPRAGRHDEDDALVLGRTQARDGVGDLIIALEVPDAHRGQSASAGASVSA